MKCKTVVCSSVGMKRKVNQDNFYVNGFINEEQKQYIEKQRKLVELRMKALSGDTNAEG